MAATNDSDDRDVKDQDAVFEDSFMRYLKRADRRSPLPAGFLERLQRETPVHSASPTEATPTSPAAGSAPLALTPPTNPPHAEVVPLDAASLWHGAHLDGYLLQARYRIEQRIAKGGMSWIYRAQHILLQTPVAIKVMFPELVEEPSFHKRFIDEARALSHLDHPHIVRVFDVFEERGLLAMALEWVDGEDLYSWFARRQSPLSLQQIYDLISPLLDALGCVHDKGMIHRDLKPDNILLDLQGPQPLPKIADFGLVRAQHNRSGARTNTGTRLGTPLYMSPEQIKDGKSADHRADLYSLGAILYELLLGRPPFSGDEQWLLLQQLHATPPSPELIWPTIPPTLADVLLRSLAKDPNERFDSCADFRDALLPCLREHRHLTPVWHTPASIDVSWSPEGLLFPGQRPPAITQTLERPRTSLLLSVVFLCALVLLSWGLWRWFGASLDQTPRLATTDATPLYGTQMKRSDGPATSQPPVPTHKPKIPERAPRRALALPVGPAVRDSSDGSVQIKPLVRPRPGTRRGRRRHQATRAIPRVAHTKSQELATPRSLPAGVRVPAPGASLRPCPAKSTKPRRISLFLSGHPTGSSVRINGRRLPLRATQVLDVASGETLSMKWLCKGHKPHTLTWCPDTSIGQHTIVLRVDKECQLHHKKEQAPASPRLQRELRNWQHDDDQ